MQIPYYHVAAFTSRQFAGNPAGVCVLQAWLPDALLQSIAAENNLAETAFIIARDGCYDLRWFSPLVEVDLCGHATLGSAYVIWQHLGSGAEAITFKYGGGTLTVRREGERLVLNFPSKPPVAGPNPDGLRTGLGREPELVLRERDYCAVFASASEVAALEPDFAAIAQLDAQGVVATAPGDDCDFVSRYFAPRVGISEDPATGSTHCSLIPYWAGRLKKSRLHARQLSARGGEMFCEDLGDRVAIGGHAVTFATGTIEIDN